MIESVPSHPVLGVNVSIVNLDLAVDVLGRWSDEHREEPRTASRSVCVTPAHSLMDCRDDPSLRAIFNKASMVTPDGMAVVWLLKAHGFPHVSRVYGPDLLEAAAASGIDRGWSHYFLGGTETALEGLHGHLTARFPGISIVGMTSPPFRPLDEDETRQLIRQVNDAAPDFLWVGLGSPRQEHWIAEHLDELRVAAAIGVGAAFDFLSGEKRQAPRAVQRSGLEWLFRLATEPRRLWPRYRRYPIFACLALADLVDARRSTPKSM